MNVMHDSVKWAGVSTLSGSSDDIRRQLTGMRASRVVAIALEDATEQEAEALAGTLLNVAYVLRSKLAEQDQQVLESLVDALVPRAPPTPTLMREATMVARSRKAVLESADWLTAVQIAKLAGFSESNPSAQPNKWKRDGATFAIRHNGVDYFPGYGLDVPAGYRPLKSLAKVLAVFGDSKDGWGLAYWFLSANSFLGGRRPQDVLATQPDQVIAAAADEKAGLLHG
ncbi:hypothetical protein [Robbsia sp. KACC 23696]|uniref:hypothetical protein n=1 Tax=Robbsia sp. KACC 23696 TaxID=3149231 RepID=UPI00325A7508